MQSPVYGGASLISMPVSALSKNTEMKRCRRINQRRCGLDVALDKCLQFRHYPANAKQQTSSMLVGPFAGQLH